MNFITIVEYVSVDSIINGEPLFDVVINEHYHKARALQRSLTLLTTEQQSKFSECDLTLEDGDLVLSAGVYNDTDNIIDVLESASDEDFEIICSTSGASLDIRIKQKFEGREDEVIYGD